jgi:hypothetical protein
LLLKNPKASSLKVAKSSNKEDLRFRMAWCLYYPKEEPKKKSQKLCGGLSKKKTGPQAAQQIPMIGHL